MLAYNSIRVNKIEANSKHENHTHSYSKSKFITLSHKQLRVIICVTLTTILNIQSQIRKIKNIVFTIILTQNTTTKSFNYNLTETVKTATSTNFHFPSSKSFSPKNCLGIKRPGNLINKIPFSPFNAEGQGRAKKFVTNIQLSSLFVM